MEYAFTSLDLKKSYGCYHALDGVTMNVPEGAIYGFVGRNGAGKTSLIRLLCGLQQPSGGEFSLYGIKNSDKRILSARKRLGAIVESPSLYLDMSAKDNLRQQYRILGLPSDRGIDDLLHLVGLRDTGSKKARHFSLGQRQRLGIAIALAGNPDFLVLDEPINGLDPEGIVEIRELILTLNQKHEITVLISSHILSELSMLATHYGFIDGGKLLLETTSTDLMAACRKCIRVNVSSPTILFRTLDQMELDYTVLPTGEIDIFGEVALTRLMLALAKDGCEILSIHEHNETLEGYYMNLIGGVHHG